MKKRIIIYGAGYNFRKLFTERIAERLNKEFCVLGVVDKNTYFLKDVSEKFPCYRCIHDWNFDCVCITSTAYYDQIKEELLLHEVNEAKILPYSFWQEYCERAYFPLDLLKGKGVEIGGPSEIFRVIYNLDCVCDGVNYDTQTVWGNNVGKDYVWKGEVIGKQIIADATDLGIIEDQTYDFLLSSNNLEHIANPLKAMKNFLRILKVDSPIIILVPCKEYSFDHRRDDTLFEHLIKDYEDGTLEDDLTHLPEIIEKHDLTRDPLAGTMEQFKARCVNNYKNRCLHHHVFSIELFERIAEYFQMEIIENTIFNENYYFVAIKRF